MMNPSQALKTETERTSRQSRWGGSSRGQEPAITLASKCYLTCIPIAIIALCSFASTANAAELAGFRTTNIDSKIELRYLVDERIDSNAGIVSGRSQQTTYEEEFSVQTRNYVYHPNFLKLDLGAGVTFAQNSYDTNTGSNDSDDNSYSLNVTASLLEKKPYPTSLYYYLNSPSIFIGLEEALQQENTRYGFKLDLLDPLIPFQINFFASYDDSYGNNSTRLIDESIDKFGFRARKVYSENYSHRLSFEHSDDYSGSGSLALPITSTSISTDLLNYSSGWLLGAQRQFSYQDIISVTEKEGVVTRDEVRFLPRLSWKHSDRARSTYKYEYIDSIQDSIDTNNQSFNAQLYYDYNKQVKFETEALVENYQTTGVSNRAIGANGRITYLRPIPNGSLKLVAGLDYRDNKRDVTAADEASVIGEIITLSGTTPVALTREFIIPGSIVVQNLARSQTFVEDTGLGGDYRVIVVGSRTEIQRLAGSNIFDGEQVVVDYDYQAGGNVDYSSLEWFYDAGVSFERFKLYLRHRLNDTKLSAGSPTQPLYSTNILEYGGSTEFEPNNRIGIVVDVEMVRERDSNSPLDKQHYNASSHIILSNSSTLRLNADWTITDNLNSVEDTNQTRFNIIVRSRLRNRMIISAEVQSEKDTGGTSTRKSDDFKLTANWNVYALTMKAEAVFGNDQTGAVEAERSRFMLTIRRDI